MQAELAANTRLGANAGGIVEGDSPGECSPSGCAISARIATITLHIRANTPSMPGHPCYRGGAGRAKLCSEGRPPGQRRCRRSLSRHVSFAGGGQRQRLLLSARRPVLSEQRGLAPAPGGGPAGLGHQQRLIQREFPCCGQRLDPHSSGQAEAAVSDPCLLNATVTPHHSIPSLAPWLSI